MKALIVYNVDYVDLIQCHDIEFGDLDQVLNETIPALRKLQVAGKVRFVGITALPLKPFQYILDRTAVDTILSYCRYSLNDTALLSLIHLCEEKGTGIINASPLSMGLLTNRGTPDWHPAPDEIKSTCAAAAQYCDENGVDIAQLAVQFSVANPAFATTLVGTANPDNIIKNVNWTEMPIDEELLVDVQTILAPIHNKSWPSGRAENN